VQGNCKKCDHVPWPPRKRFFAMPVPCEIEYFGFENDDDQILLDKTCIGAEHLYTILRGCNFYSYCLIRTWPNTPHLRIGWLGHNSEVLVLFDFIAVPSAKPVDFLARK